MDGRRLTPDDLILTKKERDELLKRQSYAPRAPIPGVVLGEVPVARSPDGLFAELARVERDGCLQGIDGFKPVQWNWSLLQPGAVKAWHLHFSQDDLFIVPPDASLVVGVVDLRRLAGSSDARPDPQRFFLGAGRCHRLLIPRGVAHGVANLGTAPQAIVYAVNSFFTADPDQTDEWRLPWDHFGADFWAIERG